METTTYHGARGVGNSGAIVQLYIRSIASHYRVYLWTETAGTCQAPLATRCPGTVVGHLTVHGLAHDRIQFEARLEGSAK